MQNDSPIALSYLLEVVLADLSLWNLTVIFTLIIFFLFELADKFVEVVKRIKCAFNFVNSICSVNLKLLLLRLSLRTFIFS